MKTGMIKNKLMVAIGLLTVVAMSFGCQARYEFTKKKDTAVQPPSSVQNPPPPPAAAVFTIIANPPKTTVDTPVAFSSQNCSGTITWAFADALTGVGPTVQHAYTKPGTYHVEATCTNPNGTVSKATVDVIVELGTAAVGGGCPSCDCYCDCNCGCDPCCDPCGQNGGYNYYQRR